MALDSKIRRLQDVIEDCSDDWKSSRTYEPFPAPRPEVDSDESENDIIDKELGNTEEESYGKRRPKRCLKKRPATMAQAKAPKLRPAGDILHRIRWDPSLDSGDFVLGYLDRFEGLKEIPVDLWLNETTEEDFVPQHRIQYFKRVSNGVKVWDREQRIDLVFISGLGAGARGPDERDERAESVFVAKGSVEHALEELGF